ncbi:putative RNA methyltransferase [Corynebacterium capitovis DSM 44611]|uniref:class I SAM-dependent RNA methyltransferase n=1 Tax=Corynebacterium capitovis TaxID=131081 RepID=UPI00037BB874|nr:TRAM domain-containing protein [Corynebacterium capitovis]WKD57539.1 putative RNA methyltransferase [Corynebacterium capitovis DSM 44611]
MTHPELAPGARIELDISTLAHGGEGIGHAPDGRVVFVRGALPGDRVAAVIGTVKKRWARAELGEVLDGGPVRVPSRCPAAARGAGCCDFAFVDPDAELGLKRDILLGQLASLAGSLGGFDAPTQLGAVRLEPVQGWRTRVRLGVDAEGRAGVRMLRSRELLTDVACSQPVPGLLDGLVGEGARTFTPGAEVVAVVDSRGQRHVVETARAQRGRRVERMTTVCEGSGTVVQRVGEAEFSFPATAFWQAHIEAPAAYTEIVRKWGESTYDRRTGWDLYGGVGLFAPSIAQAMGGAHVDTVDYSPAAVEASQRSAEMSITTHNRKVELGFDDLADPGLVVLDPPRAGAGTGVIAAIAKREPERVIHIGCDPATFARDITQWREGGFNVTRMTLIDAFPGTHHFEVIAQLDRGAKTV